MAHPTWPLFDLRIRTPRLELRPLDESTLVELMLLADRGVHAPGERPFLSPWSAVEPPERRRAAGMQYFWGEWSRWSVDHWSLPFASFHDGRIVGTIALDADRFVPRRVVGTGSWIALHEHGQGFGTEQRAAVLAFAFEHLGAVRATSAAWEDNVASRRVSEKLGYRLCGDHIGVDDGRARRGVDFAIDVADWRSERERNPLHAPITVTGLDGCRHQFGLE